MMKNVAGVNVNGVKRVDVNEFRQQMMQGYMEMAKINKAICNEDLHLEEEANNTLVALLGN